MPKPPLTGISIDPAPLSPMFPTGVQIWNPARADGPSIVYAATPAAAGLIGGSQAATWCQPGHPTEINNVSVDSEAVTRKVGPGPFLIKGE